MSSRKPYLEGSNDLEKLHDLCKRTHKEQAVWVRVFFFEEEKKMKKKSSEQDFV